MIQANKPFNNEFKEYLNKLKEKILASSPQEANQWIETCQNLSELLLDSKSIELIKVNLSKPMAELFRKDIDRLPNQLNVNAILHRNLKCENLAPFLRFMHSINGDLQAPKNNQETIERSPELQVDLKEKTEDEKQSEFSPQPAQSSRPPMIVECFADGDDFGDQIDLSTCTTYAELKASMLKKFPELSTNALLYYVNQDEKKIRVTQENFDFSRLTSGAVKRMGIKDLKTG
jgi:hypothetical protein